MLNRLQLRAAKEGIEYVPKPEMIECIEVPFAHQLPCSSSSGADFLLFVGRMECEQKKSVDFSSYGFGNRPEEQGSVPCLGPIIFDHK